MPSDSKFFADQDGPPFYGLILNARVRNHRHFGGTLSLYQPRSSIKIIIIILVRVFFVSAKFPEPEKNVEPSSGRPKPDRRRRPHDPTGVAAGSLGVSWRGEYRDRRAQSRADSVGWNPRRGHFHHRETFFFARLMIFLFSIGKVYDKPLHQTRNKNQTRTAAGGVRLKH